MYSSGVVAHYPNRSWPSINVLIGTMFFSPWVSSLQLVCQQLIFQLCGIGCQHKVLGCFLVALGGAVLHCKCTQKCCMAKLLTIDDCNNGYRKWSLRTVELSTFLSHRHRCPHSVVLCLIFRQEAHRGNIIPTISSSISIEKFGCWSLPLLSPFNRHCINFGPNKSGSPLLVVSL